MKYNIEHSLAADKSQHKDELDWDPGHLGANRSKAKFDNPGDSADCF
jgi:hypothetical protein